MAAARLKQHLPSPSYERIQTRISLSLCTESPKIRPYGETESSTEESRSYGGVGSEVSHFNKQDTQSDKDVTPHWHTLSLVPDSHLPCLISSHHAFSPLPHLLPPPLPPPTSPPIPLLFRFISVKNNESKHLQPRLHWCSNTQPADSKTHSGIKVKKGRGGGGLLLSNEIMSAEESRVQSSFAKTVRQIVVKEWPISRH